MANKRMTKAELRKIYEQWKREELEAIYVIEALGAYLEPSNG